MFRRFKKKKTIDESAHILTNETNFSIVEAYKAIRANINFAIPVQGCKKMMICSSHSGEGKTTMCVNLAITIAQTGASVVLVDCDLRRSKIHRVLNMDNVIGMSNYLSNMVLLERIIKETNIPNLRVITSGTTPPNPTELLISPKMKDLITEIEKNTDYIIFDTPPVCIVSDALPLARLCDGVVLVVSHMETTHPSVKVSLEKLKFADANVVGIILNKIKVGNTYKSYKKYTKYKYDKYEKYSYKDSEK